MRRARLVQCFFVYDGGDHKELHLSIRRQRQSGIGDRAVAAADPQQRGSPAAAATDALKDGMAVSSPPPLPPDAQRRYMRLLRELDIHALDKLLLWESYFKEEAAVRGHAAGASGRRNRPAAAAAARLRRFKARGPASLPVSYSPFRAHRT